MHDMANMDFEQLPDSVKDAIGAHLERLLSTRDYPKTICPSEVARSLSSQDLQDAGAQTWRDLMPAIRWLVWERRADGEVEVLQRGVPLSDDVQLQDIRGPIRVRKVV